MTIYTTKGKFACYGTIHFKAGLMTFLAYHEMGQLETKEILVADLLQISEM